MSLQNGYQSLKRRQFASDNYSGICPEAWKALSEANQGHALPYGEDEWTDAACDALRELFETNCEVFFTFNGTAANSLALASLCQSYHSVICHETAHIETDECGAPEFFSHGSKVLLARGADGKIDPDEIGKIVKRRADIHYPKPHVLSITQTTELGTVYSVSELTRLGKAAVEHSLSVHMDGARLANAVASLSASPADVTWKAGVDVLCFGGAKNGMGIGEAVIFFNPARAEEFAYRCKQAGQLGSKMRFIAAPWLGVLKSGAWLKHAQHANACARLLRDKLCEIPEVRIMFPSQANSVFVELPLGVAEGLRERGWHFYSFIGVGGARFMCSWDSTEEDVLALVSDIKDLLSA